MAVDAPRFSMTTTNTWEKAGTPSAPVAVGEVVDAAVDGGTATVVVVVEWTAPGCAGPVQAARSTSTPAGRPHLVLRWRRRIRGEPTEHASLAGRRCYRPGDAGVVDRRRVPDALSALRPPDP